ncbi:hypothetical protein SAMN02745664_11069 [Moraxella cuniculi DSM 21768]|uniref:Uncharacterized protein n=1 Tax=Moraxella cuniculi DSM 21768 TaxID=1122245 RepID=A0A1N7F7M1_9GAMM|nr:hypothetical protein [Moraxella cuniculi]OOS06408.1 hypothetical protein B0189_04830 [Moraxella cuniculi]SIR96319.1 hypothetical protein SAMN02745664_11069 [Moraxella cuniculi DSM 21768]
MISPFANDHEVLSLDGLSIENGFDRIYLHGELFIHRSADGLQQAHALKAFAERLVDALTTSPAESAVEEHHTPNSETIDNPFA